MAPTILIAGATGNTGRSVVETLPKLLESSSTLSDHRVIALTRSLDGPVAREFTKLPGVEVIEQNWVEITADWLREHNVTRAFIAPHHKPNQFAEESTFHHAALKAGVKYVIRISTTAANVRPDCNAYYPRSHWAIEALLDSPEFSALQWTSLQPNVFSQLWLYSAAEMIKNFRKTRKQSTLRLLATEDAPIGIIDPAEVGIFAAHLLAQDDTVAHNKARYVLNGPKDLTGAQIVDLVEQHIGTRVEDVSFKDISLIQSHVDLRLAGTNESRNVVSSIKNALETCWEGKCSVSTTSEEVLALAAPKRTPAEALEDMLKE
ncbi:NAD(P)-binding protein [Aspergillus affinis]|uniref:NAD(P)-binding protein n=1 Tax=Aspergillus affinis TaxID=1070780 RepID=UPI0022FE3B06|nr:NAD(P)-binding protein [Aspergillus affinis]KAI9044966.1 NAD(P)-binding protein [Aspergillus affinis]